MAKKPEPITYSDLEPVICDLERAVRILRILLFHDFHEMGMKHEMLSLLGIEDLETRSKDLVKLFYAAVYRDEAEANAPKPAPKPRPKRPKPALKLVKTEPASA